MADAKEISLQIFWLEKDKFFSCVNIHLDGCIRCVPIGGIWDSTDKNYIAIVGKEMIIQG